MSQKLNSPQSDVQHASDTQDSTPRNRTATEPILQRYTLQNPLQQYTLKNPLQRYTLGAIQRDAGDSAGNSAAIHRTAGEGLGGSSGSLPHLDTIQRSFGSHDVTNVQSHTGSAAASANKAMGSEAYATGNHVAFKSSSPSLHTAAHEAAHIVQQRAGVSLKGGVGQVGDKYERHADAVADAVVQRRSAEGVLDYMAGGSRGTSGYQPAQFKGDKPEKTSSMSSQASGGGPAVQGHFMDKPHEWSPNAKPPDKSSAGPDDEHKADSLVGDEDTVEQKGGGILKKTDLIAKFVAHVGEEELHKLSEEQARPLADKFLKENRFYTGKKKDVWQIASGEELAEWYMHHNFKGYLSVPGARTTPMGAVFALSKDSMDAAGPAKFGADPNRIIGNYFFHASRGESVFWTPEQFDGYFNGSTIAARWAECQANDEARAETADLDDNQGRAMVGYTAGAYQLMNAQLRTLSDNPQRWTQKFQDAYGKFPIEHWEAKWAPVVDKWIGYATAGISKKKKAEDQRIKVPLFRGIHFFSNKFGQEQNEYWKMGQNITRHEFLSFSKQEGGAKGFAEGPASATTDPRGLVVRLTGTKSSMTLNLLSFYPKEEEELFPPTAGITVVNGPRYAGDYKAGEKILIADAVES